MKLTQARRVSLRLATAAAALVTLLAGAGAATAASDGGAKGQLTESRIRWAGVGGTYESLIFVAQYQGWFKKEGITIERILATGGTAISAALAAGSIDITSLGTQELVLATDRKLGFVGIANFAKGPTAFAAISNDVAREAGITDASTFAAKLRALRGKRVGLGAPGSTTTTVALMTFRNYGLEPGRDVQTVNLGSGPALLSAFQRGQIDAFVWIPPQPQVSGGVLADFREAPMWDGVNWSGLTTTQSFLRDHPDTVTAFLRCIVRSWNYIMRFPDAAAAIAARALPNLSSSDFRASFDADFASWTGGLLYTEKGYRKATSIASNVAGRPLNIPLADATTNVPLLAASRALGIKVGPYVKPKPKPKK